MKVAILDLSSALRASPRTATMQRIILPSVPRSTRHFPARSFVVGRRQFAETSEKDKGKQNSTPGWGGRPGDDHVLHRDAQDAQSAPSHEARQNKEQGNADSNAVNQKDERSSNQRAKDENPEAPGPVIGMNSGEHNQNLERSLRSADQLPRARWEILTGRQARPEQNCTDVAASIWRWASTR